MEQMNIWTHGNQEQGINKDLLVKMFNHIIVHTLLLSYMN